MHNCTQKQQDLNRSRLSLDCNIKEEGDLRISYSFTSCQCWRQIQVNRASVLSVSTAYDNVQPLRRSCQQWKHSSSFVNLAGGPCDWQLTIPAYETWRVLMVIHCNLMRTTPAARRCFNSQSRERGLIVGGDLAAQGSQHLLWSQTRNVLHRQTWQPCALVMKLACIKKTRTCNSPKDIIAFNKFADSEMKDDEDGSIANRSKVFLRWNWVLPLQSLWSAKTCGSHELLTCGGRRERSEKSHHAAVSFHRSCLSMISRRREDVKRISQGGGRGFKES